jgi:tetratricopeptide (TPR) repeat protein
MDLRTIRQWRHQKKSMAAARRASAAHKWEIAARHYCEAIDCAPRKAALWVQYGHALKEAGKVEAGEYAYRRSLECDDRVADTHLQLARVLALQNRASEASESYLRALRLAPHSHDAIYGLLALGWTAETLRSQLQRARERSGWSWTRS